MINCENKSSIISFIASTLFLLAIYIYFIGWIYIYCVFSHFAILSAFSDIPFYFILMYSYPLITKSILTVLSLAIGLDHYT